MTPEERTREALFKRVEAAIAAGRSEAFEEAAKMVGELPDKLVYLQYLDNQEARRACEFIASAIRDLKEKE